MHQDKTLEEIEVEETRKAEWLRQTMLRQREQAAAPSPGNAKSDYSAKLRDPRWQKMRLKILERDNFACQLCFDSKSTLHVHHRYYQGGTEPWNYRDDALVTLCESCHETESDTLRAVTDDLTLILKQSGAMSREFQLLCEAFCQYPLLKGFEWEVLVFAMNELLQSKLLENSEHWNDAWTRYNDSFRKT